MFITYEVSNPARMGMKRAINTPEQIVGKLREADWFLAENFPLAELMRHLKILSQTVRPLHRNYEAMQPVDVARLKTLEQENTRPKRVIAEKELGNHMLRMGAELDL